jgi:hypothetical protein
MSLLLHFGATWEQQEKVMPKNRVRTSRKQMETLRRTAGRLRAK